MNTLHMKQFILCVNNFIPLDKNKPLGFRAYYNYEFFCAKNKRIYDFIYILFNNILQSVLKCIPML